MTDSEKELVSDHIGLMNKLEQYTRPYAGLQVSLRNALREAIDAIERLSRERDEARAEVARLREALSPFAEILDLLEDPSVARLGDDFETSFTAPDDFIVQAFPVPCHDMETSSDYVTICTVGDLRKARAALEAKHD